MRKIFKFLSYSILYLVVSVASAYGVITFSMNNVSDDSSGISSGGTQEVEIAEEINTLLSNLTSSSAIDIDLTASIDSEEYSVDIVVDGLVDLSQGIDNIALAGQINVVIDEQNFDAGIIYQNGNIYFELLNHKFMMASSEIGSSLSQLLSVVGVTMPEMSSLLDGLDLNSILSLLSNFTERINEDGNKTLEIDIPMVSGLTIALNCTSDYHLIGFALPNLSLSGMNISASASINYPESVNIENVDESQYVDLNNLISVATNVYEYLLDKEYYLTIDASYEDIKINGVINYSGSLNASLALSYKDLTAQVIIYNNSLYISAENIRLVFNLDDIGLVKEFLNNYLSIDIDEVLSSVLGQEIVLSSDIENMISSLDINSLLNKFTANDSSTSKESDTSVESNSSALDLENIKDIISNIELTLTDNLFAINYDGLNVTVYLNENMVQSINASYLLEEKQIEASVVLNDSASPCTPAGQYTDVSDLLEFAEMAIDLFKTGRFELGLDLALGESEISGHAKFDLTDTLLIDAGITFDSNDINVNVEEGMLYFDYNGLLLKMDNNGFNELLYIVLEVLGIDANSIPFLSDINLDLDFSMIDTDIASMNITLEDIISMLDIISFIEVKNNNLVISLSGKAIYGEETAEDILITLSSKDGKLHSLTLENCYLNSEMSSKIEGTITFASLETFESDLDTSKNYIDISGANELVKAIVNMSNDKQFHVSGALDIVATINIVSEMPINISVPIDVYINVVGKGDIELYGVLGEIPAIIGLNNDVPYEFGDTESGSDRYLYFYYQNGYVYLYRTEYVDIMFGASQRHYEKCTKIPLDTLLADPLYYLQYGIGLTDTIMDVIIEAMDNPRTEPMDMGNIINSFVADESRTNYTVNLNMYELTNNSDLGNLAISLGIMQDENGRNYIGNYGINLELPLADAFYMSLSTNNLRMVDYGKDVDMTPLYDFVNNYHYASETEWEASNGDWHMSNEIVYSINFNTNSNITVESQNYHYKDSISLPTIDEYYIVDDSASRTRYYYSFAGWYEDEGLTVPFDTTIMPRGDINLYAKWDYVKSEKSVLINFVTNSNTSYESIYATENTTLDLSAYQPTKDTEYVDQGYNWIGSNAGKWTYQVTRYTFAGWYTDSSLNNKFSGVVGSKDITLHAKYDATVTTEYYYNWERP